LSGIDEGFKRVLKDCSVSTKNENAPIVLKNKRVWGKYIRGVLGNKCAGQNSLKMVNFREKLASSNFLAWLSAVCVFFAALYLP
jgi:hypothetical protein